MNTTIASEILFSAAEVAKIAGVETFALLRMHPDDFGCPGHYRMNSQGKVIYTERGAAGLVDALNASGHFIGAQSLQVELSQRRQAPSRQLIEPRAKSSREPYYRRGQLA